MKQAKFHTADEWASPTDEDAVRWNALPRDEQLRQLQQLLDKPESNDFSALSFDEAVARARSRSGVRSNG